MNASGQMPAQINLNLSVKPKSGNILLQSRIAHKFFSHYEVRLFDGIRLNARTAYCIAQ